MLIQNKADLNNVFYYLPNTGISIGAKDLLSYFIRNIGNHVDYLEITKNIFPYNNAINHLTKLKYLDILNDLLKELKDADIIGIIKLSENETEILYIQRTTLWKGCRILSEYEKSLIRRLDIAKKALEYYANQEHYDEFMGRISLLDKGTVAEEALKEIETIYQEQLKINNAVSEYTSEDRFFDEEYS